MKPGKRKNVGSGLCADDWIVSACFHRRPSGPRKNLGDQSVRHHPVAGYCSGGRHPAVCVQLRLFLSETPSQQPLSVCILPCSFPRHHHRSGSIVEKAEKEELIFAAIAVR